ncbi:hypothetical protein [Rhodococcus ruber]|uniref:hypothetical protein n=2 Tax=Nocardiaceae TaxID=85025 RepID=UPI003783762D
MAKTMGDLARELEILWFDTHDLAGTGRTFCEFRGKDEHVKLPGGDPGAAGLIGAPAPEFRFLGVVDGADKLPDYYTSSDVGKGYLAADTRRVWVWRGTQWVEAGRVVGPTGERGDTHAFSEIVPITTLDPGSAPTVTITGTPGPGTETIEFGVPRGAKGPKGVQGIPGPGHAIVDALDYGGAPVPADESALVWDSGVERWMPHQVLPSLYGPWVFPEDDAGWIANASGQTTNPKTVGTFTVPAQTYAWRPMVFGMFRVSVSTKDRGMGVRVRLGNATTGQVVGLCGYTHETTLAAMRIIPGFTGSTIGAGDITTAVVAANTAATFYVNCYLASGSGGSYAHDKTGANLTVFAIPV